MNKHKQFQPTFKVNEAIKADKIRLLDDAGKNLGIFQIEEAKKLAQDKNLDLVEIVAKINPPVVRICDYSKLLYQQEKAERKQRIKERSDEMKHIRLSFNTVSYTHLTLPTIYSV